MNMFVLVLFEMPEECVACLFPLYNSFYFFFIHILFLTFSNISTHLFVCLIDCYLSIIFFHSSIFKYFVSCLDTDSYLSFRFRHESNVFISVHIFCISNSITLWTHSCTTFLNNIGLSLYMTTTMCYLLFST